MDATTSNLLVITSDTLGKDSKELGKILMSNFLLTLSINGQAPKTLFLLNSAVRLAAKGSGQLDDLELLEENGCNVLLCTTCVEFFELGDEIKIGTLSNMKTLVDMMETAGRVTFI